MRNYKPCNTNVGCMGYCLGGYLAAALIIESDVDAGVSYYGVNIPTLMDKKDQIKQPLMLHIAENDEFVSAADQVTIQSELADNPLVEIHTYEGQDHAFARGGGMHYNEAAATAANTRSANFLKQHLK